MGTPARYYSSTAVRTTLASSISSTDTEATVASSTNFPTQFPYTLILEKDSANEEIVTVTGTIGTALVIARGFDGTSARAHSAGTSVEHGVSAKDFTDFRTHEAAAANVHDIGAGASVVGTTTAQTLTNKSLGSDLAAGGFKVTGLADPSSAQDAATKNFVETGVTSQLVQATTQATNAGTSATASAASASASSVSATASDVSRVASQAAQAASETAEANAETAQAAAEVAQVASEVSATSSASSASTSTTQAASATSSASSASASAAAASASESAAAASEVASATSETNSTTSAGSAATSATSASTSADASATSATASQVSRLASEAAKDLAEAAQVATATSESNASASEVAAAASAAASSASQVAAATSETNSSTSASGAASSASSAASSAAAAASALDSFDDRYLGSKSVAPTTDNDGDALVTGALFYLNTGSAEVIGMYVFDGAGWLKASAASVASIVTYEYTATAAQTVFSGEDNNSLSLSFAANLIQVFLNGVLLNPGDDYTTSVNTVTLASGATVGDSLTVVAFASFNVANTYTIAQADSTFATKAQLDSAGFNPFLLMGA